MIKSKRIFGLDVIRAIAILLVVVSHTTYLLFPKNTNSLLTLIRAMGAVGVDLFFVLSGFLIGGILLKKIKKTQTCFLDLLLFFKRRWLRTLPNYFVILLLNILLFLFFQNKIPDSLASYFVFLQNYNSPHPDFFTEAWSLSIEEYAYLILPIIIYIAAYFIPKKNKENLFFQTTLIVILVLLIVKINYFLNAKVISYNQWSSEYRKVVLYRIDSIYLGFIFVYLYHKYKTIWGTYSIQLAIFGLISFIGLHLYIFFFNIHPQTDLFFYVFLYLQVISISLLAIFPLFINVSIFKYCSKTIQYISTRSYAIYLVNYSIVLLSIDNYFDLERTYLVSKVGFLSVYVLFTLLLSEILYRTIELPVLRFRDKKYPSTK